MADPKPQEQGNITDADVKREKRAQEQTRSNYRIYYQIQSGNRGGGC